MIEIRRNTPSLELLTDYATVPISFHGHSYFAIRSENGRLELTEKPIPLFFKDYDTLEHPTQWATRFDMSKWMLFSAFQNGVRAGGAIVAFDTEGVDMLEGRNDLAVLWDIRVHPDFRNKCVGTQLVEAAIKWSRNQGCNELKVETQDINVATCKFYSKVGFKLRTVRPNAYPELPDEIQLLWYREL